MDTLNLLQGTPEWAAHRAQHDNASDAPAMMGCSPYKTRSQLMHERHTGLTADVDAATQRRFDDGHRFEALARPLAEEIVGQDLYPVTGSNGLLSASFDGLTMCETIAFEHKSLNDELRALLPAPELVEHEPCNAIIPLHYRVQMQQQCMVSGAGQVLFMASKWDGDALVEARHCWYESDGALADAIFAGWEQFHKDLAAYVPVEVLDKPIVITRRPDQLPALHSSVKGELVLESNIKEWEAAALAYIKDVSAHDLITDEDFDNADEATKWCVSSKTALQGVRANLMGATGDVNVAVGTVDRIMAELDKTRIAFSKQIEARKAARKVELLVEHKTLLADHLRMLNARLGRDYMPQVAVDFAGAITSKRNFDSMRAALDATLANAKIAANATADKIDANLKVLRAHEADYKFLFADVNQIVLKAPDDLQALVKLRISEHQAEVARREEETRERIRAEELARIEREQAAAAKKLTDDAAAAAKVEQDAAGRAALQGIVEARREGGMPAPILDALEGVATDLIAAMAVSRAAATSANVVPMRAAPAQAPATPPTLKLGQIGERLGFSLTGDFLKSLGFEPAARDKSALLFHERDFTNILAALVAHINGVQAKQAA